VNRSTWLRDLVLRAVAAERPSVGQRAGRALLGVGALGYGAAVRARNAGYTMGLLPAHHLPCRVVCVGNLTVGGTGKTPTVIAVARRLRESGRRVCVLLRGYGRAGTAVEAVSDGREILLDWRQAVGQGSVCKGSAQDRHHQHCTDRETKPKCCPPGTLLDAAENLDTTVTTLANDGQGGHWKPEIPQLILVLL
jgi:hypothetical protein